MLASAGAGFLTGLSLIVAIGAQNAYVLRQGIRREHIGVVVVLCSASDLVLILAGVSGVGALVDRNGWLLDAVRWFGVAFLLWYAIGALRRAAAGDPLESTNGSAVAAPQRAVAGRALALTWLNPHVYLDTVLLLGSIATVHADAGGGQWWFGIGACAGSIVWFSGLGFGARALAPLLTRPRAWQVLDVLVAATMVFVAVRLALG